MTEKIKKVLKNDKWGKDIVQDGHPALREEAKPVLLSDIKSKRIADIIAKMKVALAGQDDGVGLAAAQIGEPLRIFIISKKVFNGLDTAKPEDIPKDDLVFINPEILKLSKERVWMEEGCLSVRPLFGKVRRAKRATIRAFNEEGKEFEITATGLIAQIFQHEADHLHGVLFIDKAVEVVEMDELKG